MRICYADFAKVAGIASPLEEAQGNLFVAWRDRIASEQVPQRYPQFLEDCFIALLQVLEE